MSRRSVEVIDGDVEEALDLRRVQVQHEHAVGARGGDQVRHQLRGDGHAPRILAVLPGVAEVRDHHRDARRAGALEAIDVDQQLHDVRVDRVVGRLHDEAVAAAHVLLDLHEDLAVGEQVGVALAHRQVEVAADVLGQVPAGPAAENLDVVAVGAAHRVLPAGVALLDSSR